MANRWVLGARPRTLPAAVAPVVVGTAAAAGDGDVVAWRAAAAMVVALAVQVFTNYVNDVADGERGTDARRVGPVRLVASGLATAREVKRAALIALLVGGVAGLALTAAVGPELLVVGLASFAAGYFYTGGPRPYGYAGYGEVFVFVFFGLVATAGSAYVQLERLTGLALAAGVAPGLAATALLVVNNLRDIPTDTESGKRTLAVRIGDPATRRLYVALVLGAVAAATACALARPPAALALVALAAGVPPIRQVTGGARGPALIATLQATGRFQLMLGGLLALGLWLGA